MKDYSGNKIASSCIMKQDCFPDILFATHLAVLKVNRFSPS